MDDAKQDGRLREVLKKKLKNKVMHGQYIRNMDRQHISEEDTFLWLSKGDIKAEPESEMVAAQDQALNTKNYVENIEGSVYIYRARCFDLTGSSSGPPRTDHYTYAYNTSLTKTHVCAR
jgi:hypothetical protein